MRSRVGASYTIAMHRLLIPMLLLPALAARQWRQQHERAIVDELGRGWRDTNGSRMGWGIELIAALLTM